MYSKEYRKKNKEIRFHVKLIYLLFSLFYSLFSYSQCAMCRASLESSENQNQAQAVNDGIVFLMIIPYLLVIIVSYVVYKVMKSKKAKL